MTSKTSYAYWTDRTSSVLSAQITIVEGEPVPERAQLGPSGHFVEREKLKAFCREYLDMESQIEADEAKRARDRDIVDAHFEQAKAVSVIRKPLTEADQSLIRRLLRGCRG